MSFRPGDMSELKLGMTFHFMTALWMKDCGLEIIEIFVVTPNGYECLANVPRGLLVGD
jgi:ectoine hydrolase